VSSSSSIDQKANGNDKDIMGGHDDKQLNEMKLLYSSCVGSTLIVINPWSLIGVHIAEALNYHYQCQQHTCNSDDLDNDPHSNGEGIPECRVVAVSYGILPNTNESSMRHARRRWPISIKRLEGNNDQDESDGDRKSINNDVGHHKNLFDMKRRLSLHDVNHWMFPLWNEGNP
jgi:hypothetical protein